MPSEHMATAPEGVRRRRGNTAGLVCMAVVALFLLFDAFLKLLELAPAVEGTTALGYPAESVMWIGVIELVCLVLYLIPQTAVLGALLMTGYLGGAIASYVRIGELYPPLVPLTTAMLAWLGIYLRDERLRALLPFRRRA